MVQVPVLNAEAAAQEAAAALAVAVALVQSLPKFISPYLPALLEHTLNPVVRFCILEPQPSSLTAAAPRC